ncbi:SRPBCC family protein [Quadrisphaera sp. KR29]|uniref:SRPBCC family protein n=1 Tax=Quadrisphaera sp. KR29 TaxID=3461391 RepID=UPI004044C83E
MQWTETVVVQAPLERVRRAVADEHEVMRWSAWPQATGCTCAVDGDGTSPGSEIVFTDPRGREQGRQRLQGVTEAGAGHGEEVVVAYRLSNRGPGGRTMHPEVDFRLGATGPTTTQVALDFRATPPLPPPLRQLAERVMAPRVRALHVKDLEQLKAHAETAAVEEER